jgi:membrane protein implicated in regulation of membrane protease activity
VAAERVSFTRKSSGGTCGRVQRLIEERAPVLESLELSLMDGGRIKVNGPPWRLVARRRWRNGRDFE